MDIVFWERRRKWHWQMTQEMLWLILQLLVHMFMFVMFTTHVVWLIKMKEMKFKFSWEPLEIKKLPKKQAKLILSRTGTVLGKPEARSRKSDEEDDIRLFRNILISWPSSTYQIGCFFTHCVNGPWPPLPLGFTRSCCGFFDINFKKCVNVCRDKIWYISAKICGKNVKCTLKLWQYNPGKYVLCQFYVVKRPPEL